MSNKLFQFRFTDSWRANCAYLMTKKEILLFLSFCSCFSAFPLLSHHHHHHHISIVFPSPPPTHYGTYIDLTSPLIDPKSTQHRPYIDSTLNLQPHSFQHSLFVMISIVNSEAKYHHHHHHHYISIVFHPPLQPPPSYNVSLHHHLHHHHHHHQHHHHHIFTV